MATHHAASGELVDLKTWANDLASEKSKVVTKTKGLEVARLVLHAGYDMHHSHYCQVNGPVVIHCIEGKIKVTTTEKDMILSDGQLVYFDGNIDHALTGITDSVVLLTIVLMNPPNV